MAIKLSIFTVTLGLVGSGLGKALITAATPAASFGVTATVQATCNVSVAALTISAHAAWNGTVGVSVACSHAMPYSVALDMESSNRIPLGTRGLSRPDAALSTAAILSASLQDAGRSRTVDPVSGAVADKVFLQMFKGNSASPATRDQVSGTCADSVAVTVTY